MMHVEDRVRRTIRRGALATPGTRVVAAVSGGPDSVALVHLLRGLHDAGELQLVALAHFNHRLRPDADADQDFCVEVGRGLALPVLHESADVRTLARREHRSIEDAARTARHAFFERARALAGADVVALGHTRDDQAETFLLRLLRGAGARGLASMHPRHGAIIRPLLDCRRHQLAAYLEKHGLASVHDVSNADVSIPRNRVRAELLPFLKERFNPSVVEVLADTAEVAREDWIWLNGAVDEMVKRASRQDGERLLIDAAALSGAPTAVARAALQRLMTAVSGGRHTVSFESVEGALELSRGVGGDFDAPRQRVQRIGSDIVLTGRPDAGKGRSRSSGSAPSSGDFRYALSIPGEVELSELGWVVSAEEVAMAPKCATTDADQTVVTVRRDLCGAALAVRNRRPGDRFRLGGPGGRKKLQDFFVDRKVDRRVRDRVPLVVDEGDRLVWVAGHVLNDEFRVTDPAQAVIILRLKGVGGAV
ncbi:MAG: tRNA lysidine(34) synthetase TilS [Luteitalea sp.]|nr:tRNA lysidine(34) synthetase TilS [Luteitalea sp.]